MLEHKIKRLEKLRNAVARIEKQISDDVLYELANLPQRYGFQSHTDFIKAVKDAWHISGAPAKARRGRPRKSGR
jgi:hypothetical protein